MNEFKGTPGPWEKDGVEIRGVTQHQSECICVMTPGFEREDAFMLAAAPTLFKVVNDFLDHFDGQMPFEIFEEARAAVARALGRAER